MTDDIAEIDARGEYTPEDLRKLGAKWLERIEAASKREDAWLKDAEAAETAYLCRVDTDARGDVPQFNILHSNVETIVPSIYNSTPVPDIRPRHNNTDPAAKLVADMLERVIATQIDDNRLDTEIERAAQDAFMAGRGVVRLAYDEDTMQRVSFRAVAWKHYREGPATHWSDVPWVAFRHTLSQEALEKFSDPELSSLQTDPMKPDEDKGDVSIWEIWCKDTRKVYFVVHDNGKVIKAEDDPLGLPDFFPMAEPIQPISGTASRMPVCPYTVYKKLAEELDKQTKRINAIINGLRVRGLIASNAEGIEKLAEAPDNTLVTVGDIENIVAAGGLEKAIMWWPLETAITVLRELYAQREQTKQTIYEITGISDIVRGASRSGETATAQQIKNEWGSLRIKKMQRLIERQVRDIFVLTAEIVTRLFTPETMQMASGIKLPPDAGQLLGGLDHYRINVESDSTIRADAARNKQEMGEFLTGTANFFAAMAPVVQADPQAAGPIADIYNSFARQFNLGKQAEDALEQFSQMAKQAASQPRPNPEAERAQAEMQAKQAEMQQKAQRDQAELQLKAQDQSTQAQFERERLEIEKARLRMEAAEKMAAQQERTREGQIREQEAGAKLAEGAGALSGQLEQIVAPVLQALAAQIVQGQQQLAQMIAAGNAQIIEAMNAPKEVIRDESGRPVGVRPVQQQMVN